MTSIRITEHLSHLTQTPPYSTALKQCSTAVEIQIPNHIKKCKKLFAFGNLGNSAM